MSLTRKNSTLKAKNALKGAKNNGSGILDKSGNLGDFAGEKLCENEDCSLVSEGKNENCDFRGKNLDEKLLKITLNDDELALFELIKAGFFGACTHLMDKDEIAQIVKSGLFKGKIMPYTLGFAPQDFNESVLGNFVNLNANLGENSQKNIKNSVNLNANLGENSQKNIKNSVNLEKNSQNFTSQNTKNSQNSVNLMTNSPKNSQKNRKNSQKNPTFALINNGKIVGKFTLKTHFKNKGDMKSIFTPTTCPLNQTFVSGDFELYESKIAHQKAEFEQKKAHLNAQKITAIISSLDPLHRAHERILRWTIDKADMVVIFLTQGELGGLDFALRKACLERFIELYLPKDRFFIFDLDRASIFSSHFGVALEPIIAKNLGCTKLVVGQNHAGLGMFYEANRPRTMLDDIAQNYGIELVVLAEFVYCTACKISVSTRSCPHGTHHHIKFHPASLKELLRLGIIPPTVFIRREISTLILCELFPKRFERFGHIYDDLFPSAGLVKASHKDADFYEKLLSLYQLTYMV